MTHSADAGRLPITTTSEHARTHFERGRTAAHDYRFALARDEFEAALALDPRFVLALLHRGGSDAEPTETRGFIEAAEVNRSHASEAEGRMIDAFRAFLIDGEYDLAVEIFQELSAAYPADPYLRSYLGLRLYRNLQRFDEAAAQFREALARDPEFVQAYHWLGRIALEQDDVATAEAMFELHATLAQGEPRPHDSLGLLYLRQGRFDEAVRAFERALACDPRFDESRGNLARARAAA